MKLGYGNVKFFSLILNDIPNSSNIIYSEGICTSKSCNYKCDIFFCS